MKRPRRGIPYDNRGDVSAAVARRGSSGTPSNPRARVARFGSGAPRRDVEDASGCDGDQEFMARGGRSRAFTAWVPETAGSSGRWADPRWRVRSSQHVARQPSIRSTIETWDGACEGAEFRLQFGPEQGRSGCGAQGVSTGEDLAPGSTTPKSRSESRRKSAMPLWIAPAGCAHPARTGAENQAQAGTNASSAMIRWNPVCRVRGNTMRSASRVIRQERTRRTNAWSPWLLIYPDPPPCQQLLRTLWKKNV